MVPVSYTHLEPEPDGEQYCQYNQRYGLGYYQEGIDLSLIHICATIPLSGFGHLLAQGTLKAVEEKGLLGAFSGGVEAAAAGIAAAIIFGYVAAVIFNPKG